MSFELTDEEGAFLVNLARQTIHEYLSTRIRKKQPPSTPEKLKVKCGVFVTLNKISKSSKDLRGCIGYPEPILPLVEATIDSAINAATGDQRFPPLTLKELNEITLELSVLTPLERIKVNNPAEYSGKVKIGVDGLVVEHGWNKGLLLPQVPVEWGWNSEEFLSNCCMKAGLPPDYWLLEKTIIYKFQAIIFEEESSKGKIKRVQTHS